MKASRTVSAVVFVTLIAVGTGPATAEDVEIRNRTGLRLSVYMWCQSHSGWSDMAAKSQKGISLLAKQGTASDHHAGRYRIVAVTPDRMQFSQWVTIDGGKVNKFNIDILYGAPAGGGSITLGISRDRDENEEDSGAPEQEAVVPTQRVMPRGTFAANLGIYYEPLTYSNGTFGARLTAYPVAGSPAAHLRLEPGDTIYELDGQRFRTPNDVLGHRFGTTMLFINVRTNAPQAASVYIP